MKEQNEKQAIEEMAREMCHLSAECKTCQICDERYHSDGELCYFQCVAKEIINHGYRKQSEWISVEERLPRESEVVLAYSSKFGVIQRIYTTYKEEIRWWSDEYWSITEQLGITHWMPLPGATKMKGEENG
jgi:hypothetical protein